MAREFILEPCKPIPLGEFLLQDSRFPAVYFLLHREDVVYVGQSTRLRSRIETHLGEGVKLFDAVAFIRCNVGQLLSLEGHYIRQFSPKYNACKIAKKARERKEWQRGPQWPAAQTVDLDAPIETIDASECFIAPEHIGEFFSVSDRVAAEWRAAGDITDNSVLGLLFYVARHSRQVAKAQEEFETL